PVAPHQPLPGMNTGQTSEQIKPQGHLFPAWRGASLQGSTRRTDNPVALLQKRSDMHIPAC
ncbi:MAG: hypothetical protein Q4P24_15770, partial [Rhodobacterales bacterium]|nr:hypothetical protein [Rhodobacterales bacterium]